MSGRFHAAFAVVATIAVGLALAWGFFLAGSPSTRRLERFDEQRLQDLQTIAREIQSMVEDPTEKGKLKEALPKTLAEAAARARNQRVNPRDPETGEPYGYAVKGETTYELCAKFARPRDWDTRVFWNHPAGRHCFTIDVLDPPPFY
jgi:hypothetical protein